MRRFGVRIVALAIPLALAIFLAPAAARADALKEKGLKKVGTLHVLEQEVSVAKDRKALEEAKKNLGKDAKLRKKIEGFINKAKGYIGRSEFELKKMNEDLANSPDIGGQNRKIAKMNAIVAQRNEAIKYKDAQEKKLAELGDDARSEYIGIVLKLEKKIAKIEEEYEQLKEDEEVTAALEQMKPRGKLGPSPGFLATAREIKKLRADIAAENIEVRMENQVPWVDVTINGSTTRQMVFDTGASIIAIPADMAKSMELVPPNDAPTIHMQLADGKVVEAKLMVLQSVRVGSFEVHDVEAAVLPESLTAAAPLLGGSFLRHFIHKLDRGKGELQLARIGAGAAKEQEKKPPVKPAKPSDDEEEMAEEEEDEEA